MFTIKRYSPADSQAWDRYVAKARNATFLFYRNYMDYHADRFTDHSLMFYVGNHLHSILPAKPTSWAIRSTLIRGLPMVDW